MAVPRFPTCFDLHDIDHILYPILIPLEMVLPIQTICIQRPIPHRVDVPDDTKQIHEDYAWEKVNSVTAIDLALMKTLTRSSMPKYLQFICDLWQSHEVTKHVREQRWIHRSGPKE